MLKSIRKSKNITQKELSEITGISLSAIQKYERNARDIHSANLKTLATLSIALDCSIIELLSDPELLSLLMKSRFE